MPGQPFRSCLNPFVEYITNARLEMKTWHEIADHITAQGTKTDASQVARFAKRHASAKRPFGFPPRSVGPAAVNDGQADGAQRPVAPSEQAIQESEFASEHEFRPSTPTLFPRKKTHS